MLVVSDVDDFLNSNRKDVKLTAEMTTEPDEGPMALTSLRERLQAARPSNDGFLSFMSAYWATTPGTQDELLLKLSAIYHDQIFFSAKSGIVDFICADVAKETGLGLTELRKVFRSVDDLVEQPYADQIRRACIEPTAETTWDRQGQIRQGLRGAVRRTVAARMNTSISATYRNEKLEGEIGHFWRKEFAYTAVGAAGGAKAWTMFRERAACNCLCFSEAEAVAARQQVESEISSIDAKRIKQIEMIVPRVSKLSWEAAFELRKNKNLKSFRQWMLDSTNDDAGGEAIDGLWSAFSDVIPDTRKEIMKGFASNIPLPIPVNPASIVMAASDIRKSRQFSKTHGAMIFFFDLWNSVK